MTAVAMEDYEKLLNMIMEANKYVRFAAICDHDANVLWSSKREGTQKILNSEETKSLLKRAVDNW